MPNVLSLRRILAPENRPTLLALIVACAFFMEMLDGTIIATALPQIAVTFHERPVDLSIGMSAYLLTLAVFIPSSGWMADRFGSKTIFATAIVVFTGASVLCGSSNTLWEFTAARVLQGIGGAMMVPVGRLSVLRDTDKSQLIRLTQFITTPGLVAPVLGPPVGGFITTFSSWRWIFYLNVPIGIVGLVLVIAIMKNQRAEERRAFDFLGFILSGGGVGSLVIGLDQISRASIDWAFAGTLCAVGITLCALAFFHLRRAKHPLLDLSLLRIPTFALPTLIAGSSFRVMVGSTPFLWPLLFQVGFGMSAFVSGLVIIACAFGDLFMKLFAVRILRKFGFRQTLIYNGILSAAAVCACSIFSAATPIVVITLVLFIIGILRSVQFGSFNALTYVDVPPARMSAATSFASTIQQLSFGLGIAFGALALHGAAFIRGEVATATFNVGDFRLAFVFAAMLALVSALAFTRLDPAAGENATGHRSGATKRQAAGSPAA